MPKTGTCALLDATRCGGRKPYFHLIKQNHFCSFPATPLAPKNEKLPSIPSSQLDGCASVIALCNSGHLGGDNYQHKKTPLITWQRVSKASHSDCSHFPHVACCLYLHVSLLVDAVKF